MSQRFLVTGATGQLGGYVVRELRHRAESVVAWSGHQASQVLGMPTRAVDLSDADQVLVAFREAAPTVVIHAAAISAVGDCARNPERARAVNVQGSQVLADLAATARCRIVYVSTDLVFDGDRSGYCETDPPAPLSIYGRTKLDGERAVLASPGNAVVRVSLLFGPSVSGRSNFFTQMVASMRTGHGVRLFVDEFRTPLGLPWAAQSLVAVSLSDFAGLLHVGGPERLSRLEMGRRLARHLGIDDASLESTSRMTAPGEPRPRDTSLDSSKWRGLFPHLPWPGFEESLVAMGI